MNYGVIIDGYSSGAGLVIEFNKLNIPCIHVQSTKQIPDVYCKTFHSDDYIKNFVFDPHGNNQELLQTLNQYHPLFAIPGSEPGVEVADIIANNLNIKSHNSIQTSINRRDKFLMYEKIKEAGLAYIPQFKSSTCADLIEWAENSAKWPLVIKPLKSAGGDKVKICYSNGDIITGFNEIVNHKPNLLTIIDNEVLIQEYVDAPEYAVNTVQFNGKSYLSEVVHFHKILLNCGRKIYDYATLVPFDHCDPQLIAYAFKVAQALDIDYGPMHAEIFMTNTGPVLIEAASRLMGANIPVNLMNACLTHSQAAMTTLAYANPEEFLEKAQIAPSIKKNLRIVFLISKSSGNLAKVNYLDEIKALPSFYDIKLRIENHVSVTTDYDTSPGLVYLYNEDEIILENDYLAIRQYENNNMYELIE